VPHAGIGQAEGPATADAGDGIGHAEVEDENAVLRRTAAQEIPIDAVTGGAGDRLAQAGRRGRLAEPRVHTTVVEHRRSTWHCSAATCHSLPDQDKTLRLLARKCPEAWGFDTIGANHGGGSDRHVLEHVEQDPGQDSRPKERRAGESRGNARSSGA
jgi:hypothetical protein